MREEDRTELTVIVNDDDGYTNFEIKVAYLERLERIYVHVNAYDQDDDKMVTGLTVAESESGVLIDYASTDWTRKKLAEVIQYIKSGQFDVDFAKVIQIKCKAILVKNEELRKSA
jgi:hypothetical protein